VISPRPVAKTTDIAPGTTRSVRITRSDDVLIYNVRHVLRDRQRLYARRLAARSRRSLRREIECPRHGARFDVTTGAGVRLPAVTPVPTYAVRIDGDVIYVDQHAPDLLH